MKPMKTHYLVVQVQSQHSRDTVRKVLDDLINIGLADAADTIEQDEGDTMNAQIAVTANFHSPK